MDSFLESILSPGNTLPAIKQEKEQALELIFAHYSDIKQTKPVLSIENVNILMDYYGVTARYNVINKRIELSIPGFVCNTENIDEHGITWLQSKMRVHGFQGVRDVVEIIAILADRLSYNPVKEWIESKPWDGVNRLQQLLDTVRVNSDSGFKDNFITKWLVMAVGAAFEPNGIAATGILVFKGKQHRGKTKWFESLFPHPISQFAKTGISLNPSNRDSCMSVLTNWACELGELDATFRKADIAALKSFITDPSDVWRLSYAKRERRFPRRTVLYASVNESEFLADSTGNRRFWVIDIDSCNEKHGLDMQQVWAEVLDMYKEGHKWNLSRTELSVLETSNEEFTAVEPMEDMLLSKYDWDSTLDRELSASEIAEEMGLKNFKKPELSKISIGLNKVFAQMLLDINDYRSRKGMHRKIKMPKLKSNSPFNS